MSTSRSQDWGYLPPEQPDQERYPAAPPARHQVPEAVQAREAAGDAGYGYAPPAAPQGTEVVAPAAPAYDLPSQASAAPRSLGQESPLLAAPEAGENNYARHATGAGAAAPDQVNFVLSDLLRLVIDRGASDLHLTVNASPTFRVRGELAQFSDLPVLTSSSLQQLIYAVLTQKQRETFEEKLELDFAYTLPGLARFRVNLYRQRNSVGAAFRLIPFEIKELEKLGVPANVAAFASLPRGFVLVTGATGSGKSTTLAALVDLANRTRKDHIMTVEDPIEFLHQHKSCIVNQREVGEDTHSFSTALKHALRQDPDIILVGELRDLETISVALTAAETGHLVFATLHTQDAPQTVDRLIDVFPAHQQQQIRVQLAGALQGVVSQTLCKKADGVGRAVATEVLVATPAIRNLIREGKTHQIYSAMQAGSKHGMHTLDQHLADLVRRGVIAHDVARDKCHDVNDLERLLGRV